MVVVARSTPKDSNGRANDGDEHTGGSFNSTDRKIIIANRRPSPWRQCRSFATPPRFGANRESRVIGTESCPHSLTQWASSAASSVTSAFVPPSRALARAESFPGDVSRSISPDHRFHHRFCLPLGQRTVDESLGTNAMGVQRVDLVFNQRRSGGRHDRVPSRVERGGVGNI